MKKYRSVFMLHIRSTFYKVLALLGLMGLVEFFLFYRWTDILNSGAGEDAYRFNFKHGMQDSGITLVFLSAFLLLTLLLTLQGFEWKEKISYTIRRLTLTEKEYFFVQGVYASLVYLLFLAVQIFLIFLFYLYYCSLIPENLYSHQTLFITFYSSDFLHNLLPLEDTLTTIRNLFTIPALGFTCAHQSYRQRRGKKPVLIIFLSLMAVLTFQDTLGSSYGDIFMLLACCISSLWIIRDLLRKGDGYEI